MYVLLDSMTTTTKDTIVERSTMSIEETRAFMIKLGGGNSKPVENVLPAGACQNCGSEETGYSEVYKQKYCAGCLTEIN